MNFCFIKDNIAQKIKKSSGKSEKIEKLKNFEKSLFYVLNSQKYVLYYRCSQSGLQKLKRKGCFMKLREKIYDFENRDDLISALENGKSVYVKHRYSSFSGIDTPYQKVTVDLENKKISYKFRTSTWGDFETANISFEKLDFDNYEMVEKF